MNIPPKQKVLLAKRPSAKVRTRQRLFDSVRSLPHSLVSAEEALHCCGRPYPNSGCKMINHRALACSVLAQSLHLPYGLVCTGFTNSADARSGARSDAQDHARPRIAPQSICYLVIRARACTVAVRTQRPVYKHQPCSDETGRC